MRIEINAARRQDATLSPHRREEIVRRYWLKGELTPLGVANWLAAARETRPGNAVA